jgi:hypothetical protein
VGCARAKERVPHMRRSDPDAKKHKISNTYIMLKQNLHTFSERVPSSNECHELSSMPIHTTKDISNRVRRTLGVGLAHGSLWIDVDETERVLSQRKLTLPVHLTMGKLFLFGCGPERPCLRIVLKIEPPGAKTKDWSSHGLDGNRSRQCKEIPPAETVSILLFERLQETTCLV